MRKSARRSIKSVATNPLAIQTKERLSPPLWQGTLRGNAMVIGCADLAFAWHTIMEPTCANMDSGEDHAWAHRWCSSWMARRRRLAPFAPPAWDGSECDAMLVAHAHGLGKFVNGPASIRALYSLLQG
ncbi:hypothetical protein IAQ61_004130 [Plenodomus lingam]|uniref:Predicted protein n=1 Tax=Leptosphaeria maculans (strain JN3 / isolate v23.1.3 / race Av1-4-5-6-7-8) TaxID=985895 RepID=E4ZX98_LEPMJ|nr:predicted protein [Plenodomus lingam JN3]KAH9873507.1 hypothetical protein IAQ61_004130 [Plenodomus lingam]CBX95308.1 predicted protein [Plenodomus lingam JN3]